MQRDLAYQPPAVESLKLDSAGASLAGAAGGGAGGHAASVWGSQLETSLAFVQVQAVLSGLPGVPWDTVPLYDDVRRALAPLALSVEQLLPALPCFCFWGPPPPPYCCPYPCPYCTLTRRAPRQVTSKPPPSSYAPAAPPPQAPRGPAAPSPTTGLLKRSATLQWGVLAKRFVWKPPSRD